MYIAFIYKAIGRKVILPAYKKLLLTFQETPSIAKQARRPWQYIEGFSYVNLTHRHFSVRKPQGKVALTNCVVILLRFYSA